MILCTRNFGRIQESFLLHGEKRAFKLLAGTKEEGYGGYCFFAPVEWANPCENHVLEKLRKGGDDWKWKVSAAGTYTPSYRLECHDHFFESGEITYNVISLKRIE